MLILCTSYWKYTNTRKDANMTKTEMRLKGFGWTFVSWNRFIYGQNKIYLRIQHLAVIFRSRAIDNRLLILTSPIKRFLGAKYYKDFPTREVPELNDLEFKLETTSTIKDLDRGSFATILSPSYFQKLTYIFKNLENYFYVASRDSRYVNVKFWKRFYTDLNYSNLGLI